MRVDVLADELRNVVGELGRFLAAESAIGRLNNEIAALQSTVRHRIGAAWDDGYGILADLFVHHNVGTDHSRLLSVHALGAIDHYVANGHHLGHPPRRHSPRRVHRVPGEDLEPTRLPTPPATVIPSLSPPRHR